MGKGTWLGVLGAGVIAIALGSWALGERAERLRVAASQDALRKQFEEQGQALERASTEFGRQADRLAQNQNDLQTLSARIAEDTNVERQRMDGLLSEKTGLEERLERLENEAQDVEARLKRTSDSLLQEQEKRQVLEATLEAERDGGAAALDLQRAETERARAAAKKKDELLRKAKDERDALAQRAEQATGAVEEVSDENARLAQDLQRTLADRDAAAWSGQQAQITLAQALDLLRGKDFELQALKSQTARIRQELTQARAETARLNQQIVALQAEIERLKRPTPRPREITDPAPAHTRSTAQQ